jgi:hypothetical protein
MIRSHLSPLCCAALLSLAVPAASAQNPFVNTGDYDAANQIVVGLATGDLETLTIEIDGDPMSVVSVDGMGQYEIDVAAYVEQGYVDLVAVDTFGVSELYTVNLTGEGGGGGDPPMIVSGDHVGTNQTVVGTAIGDVQTMTVAIDGVPGSAVPVDAAGNYEIDVEGYELFIELVAVDQYGNSVPFMVDLH